MREDKRTVREDERGWGLGHVTYIRQSRQPPEKKEKKEREREGREEREREEREEEEREEEKEEEGREEGRRRRKVKKRKVEESEERRDEEEGIAVGSPLLILAGHPSVSGASRAWHEGLAVPPTARGKLCLTLIVQGNMEHFFSDCSLVCLPRCGSVYEPVCSFHF